MDIDLSSLLVFRHLAQTGSFTETGKHWKISQPAVSLMIGRLESAVGLILLERSSSGTRLTTAGIQFLERANEVCATPVRNGGKRWKPHNMMSSSPDVSCVPGFPLASKRRSSAVKVVSPWRGILTFIRSTQ